MDNSYSVNGHDWNHTLKSVRPPQTQRGLLILHTDPSFAQEQNKVKTF
jgi:23S rRNA A2030 N6-methylase RlmJ